MIFKHNLVRVQMVCDYTNALLEFEPDDSVRYDFLGTVKKWIEGIDFNLFENVSLDPYFIDFNEIMVHCKNLLRQKIESVRKKETFTERVVFNPTLYYDRLVRAE